METHLSISITLASYSKFVNYGFMFINIHVIIACVIHGKHIPSVSVCVTIS